MNRLLCVVMVSACMVNVPLSAPPPNASPDQRMQAYANLSPAAENTITTVTVTNNVASVSTSTSLILHNGATIYDPGDLIPVVLPDSPTAGAAQRADEAHARAVRWAGGTLIATLVGLTVFLADGIQSTEFDSMGNITQNGGITTTGYAALGFTLAAGLIGGIATAIYSHYSKQEAAAAFATYDDSLRARLRICANGLQVVACP